MNSLLPARIAWRYLRARKSHSAVSAISIVSVCGVAVATAAIVCVLSVFNGFRSVLEENYGQLSPDIEVSPAAGKTFLSPDSLIALAEAVEGVEKAQPVLSDNALMIWRGREMPVNLKGVVPADYRAHTSVDSTILSGGRFISDASPTTDAPSPADTSDDFYDPDADTDFPEQKPEAAISAGVSSGVGGMMPGESILIFAPRRHGRVNMANPVESFVTDSVEVTGVFVSGRSDIDENTILTDIATARALFQRPGEASAIEIAVTPGSDAPTVAQRLKQTLPAESYRVRHRLEMQEVNFHMVAIEKWVSYLLLFFILAIASFNIISTMSMLVLEKVQSMATLRAMGMTLRRASSVFAWESIYVALGGGVAGVAIGVALCLAQQHFGFIKLAGNSDDLVIKSYPVVVEWPDLIAAMCPVIALGAITALIAAAFARRRNQTPKNRPNQSF